MRLGYFGGSFDPPHCGHLAVARAAAARFSLDQVLLVPTARQPLKPAGPVAGFADRLAMVTILCQQQTADPGPSLVASALEAPRPDCRPNYTVDTLTELRALYSPADSIFVLVGADAFLDLRHWREPDRLLALAEWIVVSREGFSLQRTEALALTATQAQCVHLLEGVEEPASATEIRRRLSLGEPCNDLMPAGVLAYIRSHHLYGV